VSVATLRLLEAAGDPAGHDGEIFGCAYTPDGGYALSAGWDGHLRLWDGAAGAVVAAVPAGPKPLACCAVSPDGKLWLAGSMEGMLGIWDATAQQLVFSFLAHTRPVSAIRYSPDGQQLATASWDRTLVLRKAGREREGKTLSGHADIVAGCQFTPDGGHLLSWSHDGSVRLWDAALAQEVANLGGHPTRVTAAALSPDGRWAATGGMDGGVKVWDLVGRAEAGSLAHPAEVRGLFALPDGASFVVLDAEGWLTTLSAPGFGVQGRLDTGAKAMCGELAPAGQQLAVGGEDGRVRFVVVEGFENVPLRVPVTQGFKQGKGGIGRLFGIAKTVPTYQFTCPACRHTAEASGEPPRGSFRCPRCRRPLAVGGRPAQLQPS
jgi:WD40 repeat protein